MNRRLFLFPFYLFSKKKIDTIHIYYKSKKILEEKYRKEVKYRIVDNILELFIDGEPVDI